MILSPKNKVLLPCENTYTQDNNIMFQKLLIYQKD